MFFALVFLVDPSSGARATTTITRNLFFLDLQRLNLHRAIFSVEGWAEFYGSRNSDLQKVEDSGG